MGTFADAERAFKKMAKRLRGEIARDLSKEAVGIVAFANRERYRAEKNYRRQAFSKNTPEWTARKGSSGRSTKRGHERLYLEKAIKGKSSIWRRGNHYVFGVPRSMRGHLGRKPIRLYAEVYSKVKARGRLFGVGYLELIRIKRLVERRLYLHFQNALNREGL